VMPAPKLFRDVGAAVGLAVTMHGGATDNPPGQAQLPETFQHRGPALAAGDLQGDGSADFVIGGVAGEPPRILHRAGKSYVATALPARASAAPDGPILIFDADGDGANDVLITKAGAVVGSTYQPVLLLNGGKSGFKPADGALPPLPISAGAVAAADFNHDGRLDVFIGGRVTPGEYPLSPRSALLANRAGHFEDVTATLAPALQAPGMVTSAAWVDVDGDGWADLVLTLEWGTVKYFHNDAGRGFTDLSEQAGFAAGGSGWWTSLAVGDFNGDGRPDFAVGNVGLNTPYTATPQDPALLYYGDFGGASPLAVEATSEHGHEYPRLSRTTLGAKIPSVLQRFRRNDIYARATLPEIVGEQALKAARRFAATELRSGVFLSQPDGQYAFTPLPRIAQIAPWQGIVTGDFDGDGHADIYAVQNSYAPAPAVGRFDGGLSQLFRGDGRGRFSPVEPEISNLIVPGDAKALVLADIDGDGRPEFVGTRNDRASFAYQGTAMPGRHFLRIDLNGGRANATAVGATVTVDFMDGSTQTAYVTAGSSYYSQSSPSCFFAYRDGNAPRDARVRWPRGTETHQPIDASRSVFVISATSE